MRSCMNMAMHKFTMYYTSLHMYLYIASRVRVPCFSGKNQSGNVTQTSDPKFKYLELTRHLKQIVARFS